MTQERERANSFKVGFLKKIASLGLTPVSFFEMVKKSDMDWNSMLGPYVGGAMNMGASIGGGALDAAKGLAKGTAYAGVLAPMAIGGLTGVADAKLSAPTPDDVKILHKAELLALYTKLTREINDRRMMHGNA